MSVGKEIILSINGQTIGIATENKMKGAVQGLGVAGMSTGKSFEAFMNAVSDLQNSRFYFKNGQRYIRFRRNK